MVFTNYRHFQFPDKINFPFILRSSDAPFFFDINKSYRLKFVNKNVNYFFTSRNKCYRYVHIPAFFLRKDRRFPFKITKEGKQTNLHFS